MPLAHVAAQKKRRNNFVGVRKFYFTGVRVVDLEGVLDLRRGLRLFGACAVVVGREASRDGAL